MAPNSWWGAGISFFSPGLPINKNVFLYSFLLTLGGFLLDQILGDPPGWPHPVILMGKGIAWLEARLNKGEPSRRRFNGMLLAIFMVAGSYGATWLVIRAAGRLHPYFAGALEIVLISTTLAGKSLLEAGKTVLKPLQASDLDQARRAVGYYVSRDTTRLTEGEVVRGTVETLAENFVDGIFSPLFYACLGGAPLAMAFKAVSTLDSMVGYKNERYLDFGRFAARTDDWANFIPARLTVPILLGAGLFFRFPVRKAVQVWRRDAARHPSPNGGHPESIVAGLLGIKLGGRNIYHGKITYRAEMGDAEHELGPADIINTLALVRTATWLGLLPALIISMLSH